MGIRAGAWMCAGIGFAVVLSGPVARAAGSVGGAAGAKLPSTGKLGGLSGDEWASLAAVASAPLVLLILWFADVIRPGSFTRHGTREVKALPWYVWLCSAALVFMSLVMGGVLGVGACGVLGIPVDNALPDRAVIGGVSYVAGIAAGWVLIHLMVKAGAKDGMRVRGTDALVGLGCFVVSLPLVYGVSVLSTFVYERLTGHAPEPVAHETLRVLMAGRGSAWAWGVMATAAIGAPIVEEIVFRVFLQGGLLRCMPAWGAILLSSLAFTGVHYGEVEAHALPVLFMLSLAIGVAYERTRRLGVPIVVHALFNILNLAIAMSGAAS